MGMFTNIYPSSSLGIQGNTISTATNAINNNSADTVAADREWAEEQAQKQMDYQTEMSNTSYQRAVKDLEAAGLNSALAYSQGGASTPSGTSASSSSTQQAADLTLQTNLFKLASSVISLIKEAV